MFIVTEGYRGQFGVPVQAVAGELARLREHGAVVMSLPELLQSPEAMEVVWSVPVEQEDPDDPQAVEIVRPGEGALGPEATDRD